MREKRQRRVEQVHVIDGELMKGHKAALKERAEEGKPCEERGEVTKEKEGWRGLKARKEAFKCTTGRIRLNVN